MKEDKDEKGWLEDEGQEDKEDGVGELEGGL